MSSFELRDASGPSSEWDEFVASCPGDTYSQSALFAEVKRATHDDQRVELRVAGELVGGLQILSRRVTRAGSVGYAAKGPLLSGENRLHADALVRAALLLCRRHRIRVLVVQPVYDSAVIDSTLASHGFRSSPVDVGTVGTIAVPLTGRSDEELLGAMRSALRRNIRKAERAGVNVRLGDHSELQAFKAMHAETASRNDFAAVSADRMEREWATLHHAGHLELFVTEHDGTLMSGAVCTAFGDRVLFRHAGWFRSDKSARLRPNDLLHWRIIQWARDHGFSYYDMGGFDREIAAGMLRGEDPPAEFRSSYSQFKLGYGGELLVLPRSVWRVVPEPLRPLQPGLKWGFENLGPMKRAMAGRHNA